MSFSSKALAVVRAVAPTVATALGGPFGAIAGIALSKALGTEATETALLSATPDQLLALKQAEQAFTLQLEQLGIDRAKLDYSDRSNARDREKTIKDKTPAVLAGAITLGFFGTLACLLAYGKPVSGGDALLVMLGALGAGWTAVLSYYFGSSSGSAAKTEIMGRKG